MSPKRAFLLVAYLGILASLACSLYVRGWNATWSHIQIPSMYPPFGDMRSIQGALKSVQLGLNPQQCNPGDPWERPMNYPKIWITIAQTFHLESERSFRFFVSTFIAGYFLLCSVILYKYSSLYILASVFSTSSLLAVERGNNDLLIFCLLFAGIYSSKDHWKIFLISCASILKVYPIFSVLVYREKLKIATGITFLYCMYFAYNYEEMSVILNGNTAGGPLSYGFGYVIWLIKKYLHLPPSTVKIALYGYVTLTIYELSKSNAFERSLVDENPVSLEKDLFFTGGAIYSFSYLLTDNWDYRLIFLILCLPYLLRIKNQPIKHFTALSLVFAQNTILLGEMSTPALYLSIACKLIVFIIISALLLAEIKRIQRGMGFQNQPIADSGVPKATPD